MSVREKSEFERRKKKRKHGSERGERVLNIGSEGEREIRIKKGEREKMMKRCEN